MNNKIFSTPFYSYTLIAFILLAGNLYSVFGVKALILDDMARYYIAGLDQLPAFLKIRGFFQPYTEWLFWKLLYISPYLARGFYVLLVMIPLSFVFYMFFAKYLKLPKSVSFGAAVLPNILPMQIHIPSFVNGSYCVYGLLFSMFIIILCLNFINSDKLTILYLILPFLIFGLPQIMTQAIFLFPAFSILIVFCDGKFARKLTILISFLITFFFKYFWVITHPFSDVNKPVTLEMDQIIQRLNRLFEYTTVINSDFFYLFLFIIVLSLISCAFYTKNPNILFSYNFPFSSDRGGVNVFLLYSFFYAWIVGTSYIFITQTKYFPPRYLYISSFGINCLLLLLAFYLFSKIQVKFIFIGFITVVIIFSLISRFDNSRKSFSPINNRYKFLEASLNDIDFPLNSQIFIEHSDYGTGGYWEWGTGYLQYLTRRHDITGHLYKDLSYYNAFEENRSYSHKTIVRGFDLRKPFFAYRVDVKNQKLTSVHYVLQWFTDSYNSKWILYKLNNGLLHKISNGKGVDEYTNYLSKFMQNSISNSEVLWGGCPNEDAITRLKLNQGQIESLCKLSGGI